jgi:hypothetical protein
MAHWGISRLTARPTLAVALRYGLAVASVATALGTTLILRHYGSPPRFISHFTLIAIAFTFCCAGTGPGLLALLLSCLGVSLLARNHLLLPGFPLESFLVFYAVFSLLVGWFSASRRRAEQLLMEARDHLEFRIGERTGELVRANAELEDTQARCGAGRRTWRELKGSVRRAASAGGPRPARFSGQRRPFESSNATELRNRRWNLSSNGLTRKTRPSCKRQSRARRRMEGILILNIDC